MDKKEKYIIVFNSAKQFLKDIIAKYTELNESILEKHLDHEARFDNIVDANDETAVWYIDAGMSGYLGSDFSAEAESDNNDKNLYWLPNIGRTSQVP